MKLHVRDLFWLVLVAALGCGWWVDHCEGARWQGLAGLLKYHIERGDDGWQVTIGVRKADCSASLPAELDGRVSPGAPGLSG